MTGIRGCRIAHVTSAHPADDDRIFFKEARSLARAGAAVTVIHASEKKAPADTSDVTFVPYEGGGGLKRRVLTVGKLEDAIRSRSFDLVHCHEPDGLVAALRVKESTGVRVVFDSHEMWSAVAAQRFPEPLWSAVTRCYQTFERIWVARCDAAVGASWAITDYLKGILMPERVETILNVPVSDVFGDVPPRDWGEETILCHDGHLGFDRGLKTMAEAVRRVAKRHRVVFKIVGDVFGEEREWLDEFIAQHGLQDVIVRTGWLPYKDVGKEIGTCHIGLIALQEIPNNIVTSSNKVFNYMLYGLPFVAPAFRLSKQKLVVEEGCGVLADSADPDSYADAICRLIEDRAGTSAMGARALEASRTKYRWEHMEPKLFALYERVLAG